jgi:hypothetical protein
MGTLCSAPRPGHKILSKRKPSPLSSRPKRSEVEGSAVPSTTHQMRAALFPHSQSSVSVDGGSMARNPDRVAKAESAEFSRNAHEQLSLEDLGFSP